MRKLIVQQWVTLDNVVAEADGGLSFVTEPPFSDKTDPAYKAAVMGAIDSVDTMLIGANTYNMSKDYWPHAEDQGEYGAKFNALTKFVASTTLARAPWGDFPAATVTKDPAATVRELKTQDGKDILLWGSLTLMRSLLADGLVDEVQLRVCPTTRGAGTRFFDARHDLAPIETTAYRNGIAILRYDVKN